MNNLKPISTDEMIGEFLKAELHSSRFSTGSLKALATLNYAENLLDCPDYTNKMQNKQRGEVLGLCRGWPDKYLFTNFPSDVNWFLGTISPSELAMSYRLKSSPNMTDDARLLSATAQRLKTGEAVKNIDPKLIAQIVAKIKSHNQMSPIILVAKSLKGKKVLIEGHSRSTAYTLMGEKLLLKKIPTIIGTSANMSNWAYF